MWTMLAGVPGKLKTLMDRLTAGRAANLDNLNATISSRAPASTALLNTVWTDPRAAKLDEPALLASVKSVQTGFVDSATTTGAAGEDNYYVDVSISSVAVGKSVVLFAGGNGGTLTNALSGGRTVTARLTSSTSLRLSCGVPGATGRNAGRWQVIEYY